MDSWFSKWLIGLDLTCLDWVGSFAPASSDLHILNKCTLCRGWDYLCRNLLLFHYWFFDFSGAPDIWWYRLIGNDTSDDGWRVELEESRGAFMCSVLPCVVKCQRADAQWPASYSYCCLMEQRSSAFPLITTALAGCCVYNTGSSFFNGSSFPRSNLKLSSELQIDICNIKRFFMIFLPVFDR